MSDTTSSSRADNLSPVPGDADAVRAENRNLPRRDDQPTVISNRPPLATPSATDSTLRVFQGKLQPGDRLGHFELLNYVGGGGMGRVFRARDTRLKRDVALKVLPAEGATDEETLQRFRNEAQTAARLDHESIARVHFVGEDQGLHYIAFEFIEGVNLRTLVEQKGPLSLAEAVSYSLQIAGALAHAADREVVHRDIKPSNVLLTPQGHVKLVDMGLARLQRPGTAAADLTASGVTLGTFDYISPEQARDPRNADVRSDIYSLGCTLFYMLAGRPPFPEGTVLQKLLQHQGEQPPDVRQFRPELPDEAARVLRRMLAKDPGHRYQDPDELIDDLTVLAEQIGLRPADLRGRLLVPPQQPRVSMLQRHLPWTLPIAALFCIVAALNVYWSWFSPATPLPGGPPEFADASAQGGSPSAADDDAGVSTPSHPNGQSPVAAPPGDSPPPDKSNGVQPPSPLPGDDTDPTPERPSAVEPSAMPPTDVPPPDNPLARLIGRKGAAVAELGVGPSGAGMSLADQVAGVLRAVPGAAGLSGGLSVSMDAGIGPSEAGTAADLESENGRLLVVTQRPEGENEYGTLGAACSSAGTGDEIQLNYNGRLEERPITLANLNLTIRAGEGYRPIVVFHPDEGDTDPVKYPRSMFTLSAGQLNLADLALEMSVPTDLPASYWALFKLQGGQTVRLQRCSLSIHNASEQLDALHPEVAFFRAAAAPGGKTEANGDSPSVAVISLTDSVARGEAVFLRATDLQPIHLAWNNGLLATSEQLLVADGNSEIVGELQPDARLQLELEHVTAVARGGLCLLTGDQFGPYKLETLIDCTLSILVSDADVPLIEQIGAGDQLEFRRRITWLGRWNFYQGVGTFWSLRDTELKPIGDSMTFDGWRECWKEEGLAFRDKVRWQGLPQPGLPVHEHTPDDYRLSDSTDNPAIGAGSDGSHAGCQADKLPPLPLREAETLVPDRTGTGRTQWPRHPNVSYRGRPTPSSRDYS